MSRASVRRTLASAYGAIRLSARKRFRMSQPVPTLEAMSVTVELPDDALRKLTAEAERRGVSIDVIIAELAARLPAETAAPRKHRLSFIGIGHSGRTDLGRQHREIRAEQTADHTALDF